MNTNCLVKEFPDLSFLLTADLTNEQYREKSADPGYTYNMNVTKLENTYLLKTIWPHHDAWFGLHFLITGEYNLDFTISCNTCKSTYRLASSIIIEREILKDLVSSNSFNKKETNPALVVLETKAYMPNYDELHMMKITFKPVRGGLVIISTELELPHDICDQWYVRFAKYEYQRVKGPQLV